MDPAVIAAVKRGVWVAHGYLRLKLTLASLVANLPPPPSPVRSFPCSTAHPAVQRMTVMAHLALALISVDEVLLLEVIQSTPEL